MAEYPSNPVNPPPVVPEVRTEKHPRPILIDMGRQKKKKCSALRNGSGPLMEDLMDSLRELETSNQLSGNVQPVIVVVSEKKKKKKRRKRDYWW